MKCISRSQGTARTNPLSSCTLQRSYLIYKNSVPDTIFHKFLPSAFYFNLITHGFYLMLSKAQELIGIHLLKLIPQLTFLKKIAFLQVYRRQAPVLGTVWGFRETRAFTM